MGGLRLQLRRSRLPLSGTFKSGQLSSHLYYYLYLFMRISKLLVNESESSSQVRNLLCLSQRRVTARAQTEDASLGTPRSSRAQGGGGELQPCYVLHSQLLLCLSAFRVSFHLVASFPL
jgi:hypothetical protein